MIKTLLRGVGGGFGRVLGRFLCYILLGFLIYFIIKTLGINISDYIPNIRSLIL